MFTAVSASCITPTNISSDAVQNQLGSSLPKKTSMSFENISKEEFAKFLPPHLVFSRLMLEQVEWFANTAGNIIGTIAGKVDNGWMYAVLTGDRRGNFRVSNLGGDSYTLNRARSHFLLDMEAAEKTREATTRQERLGSATSRRS